MLPGKDICERARQARDPRFDGRFFICVKTTGIYCRPVCPVKMPKAENVLFLATAAAASEAGFRPCLRCRPECAPGSPAWHGSSSTVRRGLKLIAGGALDADVMNAGAMNDNRVSQLAARLGVTDRHLRRLFHKHLGASPIAVAHTQRLHFAKRLLDETSLTMTQVAMAAGYGSVRRFNDHFKQTYRRTPRELRKRSRTISEKDRSGFSLQLPYQRPLDWNSMLRFLAERATPGVEEVTGDRYARTITINDQPGIVEIHPAESPGFLVLTIHAVATDRLFEITQTAREALDLDAPVAEIATLLSKEKRLRASIRRQPGIRVPGAWSGFELTVRAILGQQISVKAATTLAGRLVGRYGKPLDIGPSASGSTLSHVFPTPARLAKARLTNLGITKARIDTIRRLARATEAGEIEFDPAQEPAVFCRRLQTIHGIGEWTAQYVAMRVLKDPDAFLASDLGLLKALEPNKKVTPRVLAKRAENWRPWRAYAAMHLWNSLADSER